MTRPDTRLERIVESWPVLTAALALVVAAICWRAGIVVPDFLQGFLFTTLCASVGYSMGAAERLRRDGQ
jgi:hypothetical protein